MSEITRTGVFVVVAAASMGLALTMAPSTDLKPGEIVAAKLGEQFYPDFKDPNEPTSLSVVTFNEKDATAKPFSVQFKDGLWSIPSHHNYPADGAERLAKTSASAIGIKREEIRSNSAEDHVELGVVDPLDQDGKKLKGRGQRITLKKGDSTVMDLVIGKQVRNRQGFYYVRKPDEKSTYVAKIDIDISTKFADWVETDLLKLDRDDLRVVSMNNYSIDEAAGRIVDGDIVELSREKSGEPWKLKGLDEKAEELETAKVNDLVNTLDDLKLSGIRPKPEGLSEDLKLNQGIQLDPTTAMDLRSRGYFVVQGQLLSNEGQLDASTEKGVVYTLRFGEIFAGEDMAVEAGIEADKKAADTSKKEEKKEGDAEKKDEVLPEGTKANRYLFVTAFFDEKLVGPKPVKPTPPDAPKSEDKPATDEQPKPEDKPASEEKPATEAKPEEKSEAKPEEKPEDKADPKPEAKDEAKPEEKKEEPAADKKPEEKPAAEEKPESKPATEEKPAAPADEAAAKAKAAEKAADAAIRAAEDAKRQYEEDLKQYEEDVKKYDEKVKAGKEQVAKLNRRFADWYYVISAESFNKLHVARKDIAKAKTPVVDGPAAPKLDAAPKPDAAPKSDEAPKSEPKPEEKPAEKPSDAKPDAPKPEEPKPEDAKPAETKPEEPKAEPKPSDKEEGAKSEGAKPEDGKDAPKADDAPKPPATESPKDE